MKLLEVGWRIGVFGFVVQTYTALIVNFERDKIFGHIRERTPQQPPRASHAS